MIWLRLLPYTAAVAAIAGGVWWVASLRASNAALRADNAALTLALAGCDARLSNVSEDQESDTEIDNIPDADLHAVPDRWLRGHPGDGRIY